MIRKLILLFTFVSFMPGTVFAEEVTKTCVNKDPGFTIEYPATWKRSNIKGGNIVVLYMGGKFNRNIQVMYDKGGEEGGKAALKRIAKILRTQKELSAGWKEINGRRSFLQVVEWKSPLGVTRAIRMLVPIKDHYFLVMGVCPGVEFGSLEPLLKKCVLSFKIT